MSEWFQRAKAALLAFNQALRGETVDLPGTVVHAEGQAIRVIGDEVSWTQADLDDAAYLDTARGDKLSRWGADRYDVLRHGATRTIVPVLFARSSAGALLVFDAGTRLLATNEAGDELEFILVDPVTLAADATQVSGEAVSALAGAGTSATITGFASTPAGASAVAVSSTDVTAGGNDAEDDAAYVARIREAWRTSARGTRAAIEYGALLVPEVRRAAAHEILDGAGRPVGAVSLVVSDDAGQANDALAALVDASLDDYRAFGVGVWTLAAVQREEAIAYSVVWAPGFATSGNKALTAAAVVATVNRLAPNSAPDGTSATAGSILDPDNVASAVRTVAGVLRVTVTVPAGAVEPAHREVIRTRPELVTVS